MAKVYSRPPSPLPATLSDDYPDIEYSRKNSTETPSQYPLLRVGFTFLKIIYGVCWSAAYVLYVLQARKDQSSGMPLLALMLNFTWEFLFTFVHKQNGLKQLIHLAWFCVDVLLVVETLRFGPKSWAGTSPIIAEHFVEIFCIGSLLALSAQWTFANQFSQRNARFWTAYFGQHVISWGSLWMLAVGGHAGGHSMSIWSFGFIGTFAVNLRHLYRLNVWPGKYGFLGGPFAVWILWMPCVADLLYPFVYRFIEHASHEITQK